MNVARRGENAPADPPAARAQIEVSFATIKRPTLDLVQVHNLGDVPTQLGVLAAMKEEGRIRYVVSHPAITVVTPATSQARHVVDNIGGGIGRRHRAAA